MVLYDPIEYLRKQYVRLLDHIRVLSVSLEALAPEALTPEALEALLGAVEEIRDAVWAHSERVDAALFPVLEPLVGNDGIIVTIRREHRAFRRGLGRLVKLVRSLKENTQGPGGALEEVVDSGQGLAQLLSGQIHGEDEVLYPLARRVLSEEQRAEVRRRLDHYGLGEEPKDAFLETEVQHESLLHILSTLTLVIRELRKETLSEEGRGIFARAQKAMAYEIKVHNRIEEEILFPILGEIPALSEIVRDLREEHKAQWDRLKEVSLWIRKGPSKRRQAGEALEKFVRDQSLHIYKENILLFPMARRFLSEEKLRTLARRAASFAHQPRKNADHFVGETLGELEQLKSQLG